MDKEDAAYIQNRLILNHKKDETLPIVVTQMDLKDIILSEISQIEKYKYHKTSLIRGIQKKTNKQAKIKISKQTKPIKNKHVDTEKRIVGE